MERLEINGRAGLGTAGRVRETDGHALEEETDQRGTGQDGGTGDVDETAAFTKRNIEPRAHSGRCSESSSPCTGVCARSGTRARGATDIEKERVVSIQ